MVSPDRDGPPDEKVMRAADRDATGAAAAGRADTEAPAAGAKDETPTAAAGAKAAIVVVGREAVG